MGSKISFKRGVTVNGIELEMSVVLPVVASVFHQYGYDCIVTSCTDGKHSDNSLHYVGLAMDFRTRHIDKTAHLNIIADDIREALTDEYDVIIERTHIHIEFDPDED